jgi:CMP-N,N'-diacetyllegionaminic acid synthase
LSILILIPARKGSKRIPNKNLKILGDKPLIQWTFDIAKQINPGEEILVSTDSDEIRKLAIAQGILCPWLRPDELATDFATSVEVAIHSIEWYENNIKQIKGVLLLQPTSPFRNIDDLKKGIEIFNNHPGTSVIGVSPALNHPQWTFRIQDGHLDPFLDFAGLKTRSQDLEPAYCINGSFYLISPNLLKMHNSFFLNDSLALVSVREETKIDIDTYSDWEIAENFIKSGKNLEINF